jgi:asparagine synthase (glutamine-hydrolysing)
MCGLSGIISSLNPVSQSDEFKLEKVNECMSHRGPDASGVWFSQDRHVGFAHRRLSVIDLNSIADQPLNFEDLDWVVVFNGEIFNFQKIRLELGNKYGYQFKTNSDTEVINALLHFKGAKCFEQLDGQFAIGAYNKKTKKILLARDQFGEKPFYYGIDDNNSLWFASEVNALIKNKALKDLIEKKSIHEYLIYQYIPEPNSIYKHVKKLPKGHYLEIDGYNIKDYKMIKINTTDNLEMSNEDISKLDFKQSKKLVKELLINSLQDRVISDVPIGMFLSGGIDSSLTCSIAKNELNLDMDVFSLGYIGEYQQELFTAKEISQKLGFRFHPLLLDKGVANLHPLIASKLDEPNGDISCLQTFLISKFARETVTVAISGDGADELFAGYPRYRLSIQEQKNRDQTLSDAYYPMVHLRSVVESFNLMGESNSNFYDEIKTNEDRLNQSTNKILALRKYDLDYYLPGAILAKVDRMSMASSLEVRTPFLTESIKRTALNLNTDFLIQGGQSKVILRSLLTEYLGRDIANLPKQGFAFPESSWVKESLISEFQKMLKEKILPIENFISFEELEQELYSTKVAFNPYKVWSILILNSWLKVNSFSTENKNQLDPVELILSNVRILWRRNIHQIANPKILQLEDEKLRLYLSAITKANLENKRNSLLIFSDLSKQILRKNIGKKYYQIIHISDSSSHTDHIVTFYYSLKGFINKIWFKYAS